jgi:hypothetical protein
VALARYVSTIDVSGHAVDLQVVLPVVDIHGGGSYAGLGSAHGVGDPLLVGTFWFINDAANRRYFAINPYLWLPVGEYQPTRALNPGEHRWKGDVQVAWSQGFGEHWAYELNGDVQVNGTNDRYRGSSTLKQKPVYDSQVFLRYTIDPLDEVALRVRRLSGGENRINGVEQHDNQSSTSALVSYSHFFPTQKIQLLVQTGRDINVENGLKEESRVQVRVAKIF